MVFVALLSAAAERGTIVLLVTEQVEFWSLKRFLWICSFLCGQYLLDLTPRRFLSVGAGRKNELNKRLAELNFFWRFLLFRNLVSLSFFPACFFSSRLCLFCKYLSLFLIAEAKSIHHVCCRFASELVLSQHTLRRLQSMQAHWGCCFWQACSELLMGHRMQMQQLQS